MNEYIFHYVGAFNMLHGILQTSWLVNILIVLMMTHVTSLCISLFLHRGQAHRAIDLHTTVSHVMRFWLWMSTGMLTKEWVAIHRNHHAHSDIPGDPHSPQVYGIRKVLFQGAELYREAANHREDIEKYGKGTPDDWIERNVYSKFPYLGITFMFVIDLMLFGLPGITMWALQMMWTPFVAAGAINGIGHFWGYRNFECPDAARNISPIGIFAVGEELHNNHHAFGSSAKFSTKWWEFDIGWMYIKILTFLNLATVRKVMPTLEISNEKVSVIDFETLKTIINNRIQVMQQYSKWVVLPVLSAEKKRVVNKEILGRAKMLLIRDTHLISEQNKKKLQALLAEREELNLIYQFRLKLQSIWDQTTASHKELIESLHEWCRQAEATGNEALQRFSEYLKAFRIRRSSSLMVE